MLLLRREVFASLALRVSVFSSVFLVRFTVVREMKCAVGPVLQMSCI